MSEGQLIASETFRALEVYSVIAAIYFAVCYPLSQGLLWFERQVAGRRAACCRGAGAACARSRALLAEEVAGMSAVDRASTD